MVKTPLFAQSLVTEKKEAAPTKEKGEQKKGGKQEKPAKQAEKTEAK